MTTRALVLTTLAVTLGLAAGSASAVSTNADRLTYLTFSGPVALPGVTLAAGTYAFDIFNADSSANVVRVRNKDRSRTYFLGMTERIDRPAGLPADRRVTFGEAARGAVPPIAAWYPNDASQGRRFLYEHAH